MCQRQIVPFLRMTNLCDDTAACNKAMLAGQRSSRGLLQWSRLGEQCTQAQCPWPPGAVLRPFRRPASVICGARFVCGGVLVTRAGANWARGEVFRRVLAWDTLDQRRSVRPYAQPPLTAQRTTHGARQAPTPTMVCGGGGGAPAVVGEGVVKGLCARMQAHADVQQCAVLASRRG